MYFNRPGFNRLYPIEKEDNIHDTFAAFMHWVGIPHGLHSDNTKTQVLGEFKKKFKKYEVHISVTDPYTPWQSGAER